MRRAGMMCGRVGRCMIPCTFGGEGVIMEEVALGNTGILHIIAWNDTRIDRGGHSQETDQINPHDELRNECK